MESFWPEWDQLRILGSVPAAMFLGALVGLDREIAGRPAGLRTQMLVAGASAAFVALGDMLVLHYDGEVAISSCVRDPIRIIEP